MMSRRNLLLIVVVILGLVVTLGLQGCGLLGGDDEAAEGEEGAEGAPQADMGAEGPPGAEMPEGAPAGEMGGAPPAGEMGGPAAGPEGAAAPPADMGGPADAGVPGEATEAAGGQDVDQLVSEALDAKHDGNYVDARNKLEQAVEADPDHAEANRVLGWIYAEMADSGQPSMEPQAIEHFETFLQKGGTDKQVSEVEGALERMQ